MKAFFFMVALACRSGIVHGAVVVVIEETVPVIGDALVIGTVAQELTPRLLISVESSGIPARAPGVADDAEVGAEDEATLEPEPHIPAVAASPEVAANPAAPDDPDDIGDAAPVPDVDAVAGAAVPFSVTPPPS
jgi:hypothetical protein